ncbi:MAG: apolipoprotein N-acyltransferase [Myxococcota bacterium]|nr:apolipoprotein N-acyltransferase [Myxococcota bacterium]
MPPKKDLILAALSGALYFLGFVGFGFHPLIWVCFVPVLVALENKSLKQAIVLGVVFGFVTNLGGYYWVINLIEQFANLHISLATLGYFLLCLYQGFLLTLVLLVVQAAKKHFRIPPVWALPVAFVGLEKFYPLLFPSFIGNSIYEYESLIQSVDVFGMLGLTMLISLVNGAFFEIINAKMNGRALKRLRLIVPLVFICLFYGYGKVRLQHFEAIARNSPKLRVGMVQTNLGAKDKRLRKEEFMAKHIEMTRTLVRQNSNLDLVVWPESAYNGWILRSDKKQIARFLKGLNVPIILGALTYEKPEPKVFKKYNSAVLVDDSGLISGIFDKVILLAFGETIPGIEIFPFLKKWLKGVSVFDRGTSFEHLDLKPGVNLLPMVCYEDIIPSFVRQMWNEGGPATMLVNITNDSWYGDTHEPLIHLVLASFRSLETRRYLVRSTNTGISAIVDNRGNIVRRTKQWTKDTIVFDVPIILTHRSTIYMRFGDVLGWLSGLMIMLGFLNARLRRYSSRSPEQSQTS